MRTRSSRSYTHRPRDVYEVAGHGLLDTIEESFYVDDIESDLGHEENDTGSDLPGLFDEEEDSIAVHHSPRRLNVRLRLTNKHAAAISPHGPSLGGNTLAPRDNAGDGSMLEKDLPRLMVVLRMPQHAGQVEDFLADDIHVQPVHQRRLDAVEEAASEIEGLHEELGKGRSEGLAGVSANDDSNIYNQTMYREEILLETGVEFWRNKHMCVEEEVDMEVDESVEHQDGQMMASELLEIEIQSHDEYFNHVQKSQAEDGQAKSFTSMGTNHEHCMSFETIAVPKMETECHYEEDVPPGKQHKVDYLTHGSTSGESLVYCTQLLSGLEAEGQIESQPEKDSFNSSERGSSPDDSSSSSLNFDDDLWRVAEALNGSTASLVPTPLTVPSPDLASVQLFPLSREPSPQLQPRKRSRSVDDTGEAETHSCKRQRLGEGSHETDISMAALREATRGTGILEAGLMAQQRRNVLGECDHAVKERMYTPKRRRKQQQVRRRVERPKRKPLEKSGRQIMLEHRILSSSQRPRGSGKARVIARLA